MYGRQIEGRELTFGVSGKLIMNALVMYDRQTDSLWSQFLGVAVAGHFEGSALEPLGSILTTWGEWRDEHPGTLVLDQGGRHSDAYAGYYTSGSAGVLGESLADYRLDRKEFVAVVQWDGGAKAYPFRHLSETPIVNDAFRGRDLLVVFSPDNATVAIYDRTVGGRALTFEAATGVDAGAWRSRCATLRPAPSGPGATARRSAGRWRASAWSCCRRCRCSGSRGRTSSPRQTSTSRPRRRGKRFA